jgi:hypothetical protein
MADDVSTAAADSQPAQQTTQRARNETTIQTPPRLTGDYNADAKILNDYLHQFYQAAVVQSGLLDPTYQAQSAELEPDNLPDPANTTIAQAQLTANEAFQLGTQANSELTRTAAFFQKTLQLASTNNQLTYVFGDGEKPASAEYVVLATTKDFSGAPAASAFVVTRISVAADSFTFTTAAAPGVGNTVSFDVILFPKLT